MNAKFAVVCFLATCLILAILLLFHFIAPPVSGMLFAVALAVFGGLSKGFRKKQR
ncbi:MAG TPA: hypothetical protein VI758_02215 [Bacteroidota bacterium]